MPERGKASGAGGEASLNEGKERSSEEISNASKARFIADLERLIRSETAASKARISQIWDKPLPKRVAEGYAIEGLRIAANEPNGDLLLEFSTNQSRFREGDVLCLNQGNPGKPPSLNVSFEEEEGNQIRVSPVDFGIPWAKILEEKEGWQLDEGYLDFSAFYLGAIRQLADTSIGRDRILPILMGNIQPVIDTARLERGFGIGDAAGLNWSQSEALAHAYATDSIYLIQGPPGTGKTRVLAHLAEALVDEGERVLVTAFTHRAINNALNTLDSVAPLTASAKIGNTNRTDDLLVENFSGFESSPMSRMSSGYVIGATPFATQTERLAGVEFETVIFDESSQITVPLAIMGMLPARRYIFIGDHQQLPPVLQSLAASQAGEKSVFGFFVNRGFDTMLQETYRLSLELAAWPSQQFYDGQLETNEVSRDRKVEYQSAPRKWKIALDPDRAKVFIDVGHKNARTRSRAEASVVVDLIAEFLACGISAGDIGVVTPYRAQAREIRFLLRSNEMVGPEDGKIVIDTVERMQGQERDIIILSLTTSDGNFALKLAEFFYQPQRMNVAITRPRRKLIIVGSSRILDIESEEPDIEASIALLEDLLKSCDCIAPSGELEPAWQT